MPLLVYRSSAGSGKTFTLVKEYLKIVLINPYSYRNVLAITFTNKATAEMKSRITQTLAALATNAPSAKQMMHELTADKDFKLSPEVISLQAARVLQLILHGYSEFSVSTIDSFMHRVVRAFAFDLHLPVNFEVEIDTSNLIDRTIEELLNQVGTDHEITRLLTGFVKTLVDDEKGWDITSGLEGIAQTLFDERERQGAERLRTLTPTDFVSYHIGLQQTIARFEKTVTKLGRDFMELMAANGVEAANTAYGTSGFFIFMERLAHGNFTKMSANKNMAKSLDDKKWNSGKCDPLTLSVLSSLSDQIEQQLTTTLDYLEQHQRKYNTLTAISDNFFPMATLSLLDILLIQVARNRNLVHLSEFNRRIAGVVLNEPVPFIYARLGEKYHHFLIDEFQDTSVMQWQNILPLVHNALATPDENHPPVAMIVGDSKQAIYRWRNGETEQFQQLPLIFHRPQTPWFLEAEQILVHNYQPKELEFNYRSSPQIIEFNNRLFKHAGALLPEKLKNIYNHTPQKSTANKKPGLVEVHFSEKQTEEDKGKQGDLNRVKEAITKCSEQGFSYSQMAVLCRGNDDCATVARELLSNAIPVISSESLLLSSSPKVSAMITAMRLIHQPYNKVHEAALNILLQTIGKADHISTDIIPLVQSLTTSSHLLVLPLYDMAESILRMLELHLRHDIYLQFFLDAVQEFSKKDYRGLAGFLEWWDEQRFKRSVDLPEGANAVQIMTIHKAKGLAFDIVLLPFIGNTAKPGRLYDWINDIEIGEHVLPSARVKLTKKATETSFSSQYNEEMDRTRLDTLNLLYVAFTRAAQRLYIFSSTPSLETDTQGAAFMLRTMLNMSWPESAQSNLFVYGQEANQETSSHQTPASHEEQAEGISFDWHSQIAIGRPAPTAASMADITASIEFGIMIHNILSNIITPADIAAQIEKATTNGKLTAQMAHRVETRIREIMNQTDIAQFFNFAGQVRTEAPLLLPNGNLLRPDRLLLTEHEAHVIDFKTGKPNSSHHEQIHKYASALSDLGYRSVRGWLLYLSDPPHAVAVV